MLIIDGGTKYYEKYLLDSNISYWRMDIVDVEDNYLKTYILN